MEVTHLSSTAAPDGNPRIRTRQRASLRLVPGPAPALTGALSDLGRESLYRRGLGSVDAFAATSALIFAALIGSAEPTLAAFVLLIAAVVLGAKLAGLYDRDANVLARTTLDEIPNLVQLGAVLAFVAWLLAVPLVEGPWDRTTGAGFFAALTGMLILGRFACRRVLCRLLPPERLLVMAEPAMVDRFRDKISFTGVNATIIAHRPVRGADGRPLAAPSAEVLAQARERYALDRVVISPVSTDATDTISFIRAAKSVGLRVTVIPRMLEAVGSASSFDHVGGMTMLGVPRPGLTRSSALLKRALDIVGACTILLVTGPVMLACALWVKFDSRGPVLFRQQRVGRDGRVFHICKFRTMVPEAEALKEELRAANEAGALFKIADDPRVTRAGRFLRMSSLDELPQVLNVLRGDMALVGPRPLVLDEDQMITGTHRNRLMLTPGMTGPWQILGSARVPLEEMVNIDYLYVANWSLWQDFKILLRTIPYALARGSQ